MDNVFSGSRNGDDVGHAFGDLDSFLPHDSRPPPFSQVPFGTRLFRS